jgi:hypothetical protein
MRRSLADVASDLAGLPSGWLQMLTRGSKAGVATPACGSPPCLACGQKGSGAKARNPEKCLMGRKLTARLAPWWDTRFAAGVSASWSVSVAAAAMEFDGSAGNLPCTALVA